ncbi:hypothetical protein Taro_036420 [Colocasia esculenta]|uniref:Uncharacterized protein n=1 Tax=Colocasia esculenta TaxID=4460 RepID=A0A843WGA0_COLES|nr:hypothetical protein [Colocasia esculenta]
MAPQAKNGGALAYVGTGLERAIEELQQISHIPEEIQRLIPKVNRITAVMKDAEQKPISSHEVRHWLQESKQILLDAEDVFDELATDAAVQMMRAHTKSLIGFQNIVRFVSLFPAIPTMTRAMRRRLHEMNGRLDLLASQKPMLLQQMSTAPPVNCLPLTWRQTGSHLPDETSVIGRDREKEQIIEMLTQFDESSSNNNKGFSIVPIVGLGGVGKTTLAQLIFNDQIVKNHFELMMWVCVSNDVDCERVTKDMIEAALAFKGNYEECQVTSWDWMQRRLLREVEGKTFLLVLDDVWEAEHSTWEELFKPLHSGEKGSKVLVTARNMGFVAKLEGRIETPIFLEGLSHDDAWDVLKKYAFRGADGTTSAEYSDLEDLGRRIVQKLKGSPLAARTTGSLLNHELSKEHWQTVLGSECWKLELGQGNILPALLLSYQHLPPDLKQCFAYCSLFPKDYRFSKEEIGQLWEAQTFIRKDRGTRMETMGSKYFDELLHKSFFESKHDNGDYYVMHDLVHDLAEYVSSDHCFMLEDQKIGKIPDTVRHMSVTASYQIDIINKSCFHEKLRSFLFQTRYRLVVHLNTNDLDQLFQKLKMLRVLGLRHCGIRELPGSIGDLKHLRYIDLEWNHRLNNLPESLGNLYNLQVLNLNYCRSLRELPSTMSQLVNLRHLQAYYELVSNIDGVGKLTGLQELQVRGRQVRELEGMCMLRELKITNLEEVGSKEEAIQARLQGMERLQVLQLEWNGRWASSINQDSIKPELEGEVLQALQPNKGIRELHIEGYGGVRSPDWMEVSTLLSSFSSLRRVSLENCPNWQVPPCSFLSQLRHLEHLLIFRMPKWEEWSCPVSWDCIRQLTIRGCPKLKELPLLPRALRRLDLEEVGISCLQELGGCSRVEGGIETTSSPHSSPTSASLSTLDFTFCDDLTSISRLVQQQLPDLVEMEIRNCQNLVSLPEKGFGHLVSLKILKLAGCPKLTCLLPMQKEEKDALSQHLPCSLEELEIEECGDAMGGWWWAGLHRLTSMAKLSLCGCPTTAELLFLSLGRHHHPLHLPATLRELWIDGYNRFNHGQQSTTFSACSSHDQLSPPPPPPMIPHSNVDASARALRAFTSLKQLTILRSPNFLQKWGGWGLPSSLELLTIAGDDNLDHKCLSSCLHDLISLKELDLQKLENLRLLPNLSGLTSLATLSIKHCRSIHSLSSNGLPPSLQTLHICECPELTGRRKDKPKSTWHEVAQVPCVVIDSSKIQ